MKPTEPGWYWLRQNGTNMATGFVEKAKPEVAMIAEGTFRTKKCLMVCTAMYGGFRAPLEDVSELWDWHGPITPPEF